MALARSVSALVLSSSIAVALLAGCGGRSIGDDLTGPSNPQNPSTPTDPNNPTNPVDPPACPAIAPACDPGDRTVGSEAECSGADYCYSRTQACSKSVVWCAHDGVAQCDAVPTCDAGDKQVATCPGGPSGFVCYPRTLCGATIQCLHVDACKALPQCNPGDVEVTAITTCSQPGVKCYPVTECNFTIHCYTP